MPQETINLLDERIISNRGLLKRTPDKDFRRFIIQCQLIRYPRHNFLSKKINPDRSEYAQIAFVRDDVVLREERLNFPKQQFVWDVDSTGYLAYGIICNFQYVFDGLAAIGGALGLTPSPAPFIYMAPIEEQFDEVRFVVRDDGAIGVKLYGLKYDKACPEADDTTPPPPPPPPDFPNYPPGTDLADTDTPASPPYDGSSDNGSTNPLPGDSEEEPPPPEDCTILVVTYQANFIGFGLQTRTFRCYAPYEGIYGDGFAIYANAAGLPPAPCTPPASQQSVNFVGGGYTDLVEVSVVPE